jgi:hypothetical protein
LRRWLWVALIGFLAGAGLGLLYAWVLMPVRYVDTTPSTLRADFKDQMRSSIAASYVATGNLERARARLALLGDPDTVQALSAQAQRMVALGDPYGSVEQVVQLAADLETQPQAVRPSTRTATLPPTRPVTQETAEHGGLTETVIPGQTIEAPAKAISATPRPTRTVTPPARAPFELVAQDTLCEADLPEGLLQVIVTDARRRPVPGAEIIAAWDGGEEHFFTGFKPELGDGYADFVMQPGTAYSVRVAEGSPPISQVIASSCTASDEDAYTGQIRLTFQQH